MDWHPSGYGLNHALSATPCSKCGCSSSAEMAWTDCRDVAAWRHAIFEDEAWKLAHPNAYALWHLPFMGITTLQFDVMHTKHLGVDAKMAGSWL
eukprot:2174823-Amphidinium_carterae.1